MKVLDQLNPLGGDPVRVPLRNFLDPSAPPGADVASVLSKADQGKPLQPRPPRVVNDSFRAVTLPEFSHALRSMYNSKACSDDGIMVDMLRRTFAVIGPHLLHVVNSSLVTGLVPLGWKSTTVLTLQKR